MSQLPLILDIYHSSQSLKIVGKMFGMCIYHTLSLIYQTNQQTL